MFDTSLSSLTLILCITKKNLSKLLSISVTFVLMALIELSISKEYLLIHRSHDVSRDLQRHPTSDYTVTIDTPFFFIFQFYLCLNSIKVTDP